VCLTSAHTLLEMEDGRVATIGTIADLRRSGLLKTVIDTEDEEVDGPMPARNEADVQPDEIELPKNNLDVSRRPSWQKELSSKGKLIDEESRAEGRVTTQSYLTYIRAAGWRLWIPILCLMPFLRVIGIVTNVSIVLILIWVLSDCYSSTLRNGRKHTKKRPYPRSKARQS
jgi:hypothetical protein